MSVLAAKRPPLAFFWLALAALLLGAVLGSPVSTTRLSVPGLGAGPLTWTPVASTSAAQVAFAELQRRVGGPLTVHWEARSGIPDFLAVAPGAAAVPYTPTAAERGN